MKRKNFLCAVCALLCVVFAFALVGCGRGYTDEDDYANFVRWQARYETEKELVGLLREYDAAYTAYTEFTAKASGSSVVATSIAFVFEGRTVLTDENIKLVETAYDSPNGYFIAITFDSVGTAIFADLTSSNIGGTIEIVETRNGQSSVLSAPAINSAVLDGRAVINGNYTAESVNELYVRISAKTAERSVRRAASAYNDKRSESSARYSLPEYLPTSLAVEPQYINVSAYLQKAEAVGFTA